MRKVCHMTSAHKSDDTRIFHKECVSLAKAGYDVFLVAQGESYEKDGVHVVGVEKQTGSRLSRMLFTTKNVYKAALSIDADIYHIHDPELLPFALKLHKSGKRVIYDSHEDYPSTILCKPWLPKPLRKIVSMVFATYEKYISSKLDGIIACYHWTKERLENRCSNTELIFNFPIIKAEDIKDINKSKSRSIAYAGGISSQWNIKEIIEALSLIGNVHLELAGSIDSSYGRELTNMREWECVNYHGKLQFEQVYDSIYSHSVAGVALLDYIPQCRYTVGNLSNTKLFEYMYAELPVICTNFKLWEEIIERYSCGICVNPHDISQIARAIKYLTDNPQIAEKMGANARMAILNEFNWTLEAEKLLKVYSLC